MNVEEAYRILGVRPGTPKSEIKKRYHKLMHRVHPDAGPADPWLDFEAHELNEAYEILKKEPERDQPFVMPWDAPEVPEAYRERDILQYAEDGSGKILGRFSIARGRYEWREEEEFPLFLLSLFRLSKDLLDEVDEKRQEFLEEEALQERRGKIQGEITYLLAREFMDAGLALKRLTKEVQPGIFYIPSMLELNAGVKALPEGETLYPGRMVHHRLYLKDRAGREVGYLSFEDDRLYYVVIPLLEQRLAQVKLKTAATVGNSNKAARMDSFVKYQKIRFWIRLDPEAALKPREAALRELNRQIAAHLQAYGEL